MKRFISCFMAMVLCLSCFIVNPIVVNAASGITDAIAGSKGDKVSVWETPEEALQRAKDGVYGDYDAAIQEAARNAIKLKNSYTTPDGAKEDTITAVNQLIRKAKLESSRAYGLAVYIMTIPGISGNMPVEQVVSVMEQNAPTAARELLGYIRKGGKDMPFNGTIEKSFENAVNAANGQGPDRFFELLKQLNPSVSDRYAAMYQKAMSGQGSSIPAIVLVPCVGTGDGGVADAYDVGGANYCFGPGTSKEALSTLFQQAYNTTIISSVTYENITTTGNTILSGYAIPIDGDIKAEAEPGTFYVTANPEKSATVWAKVPSVTGTYKVYNKLTQLDFDNAADGYITIEVKADFSTGNSGKAPNNVLTAGGATAKLQNEDRWTNVAKDIVLSGTSCSIRIPVTHLGAWNDYGGFIFSVPVSGGHDTNEEECRPAAFQVSVNGKSATAWAGFEGDKKWMASGTTGLNYTSWIGGQTITEDIGYDFHTALIPHGESLVVANTAKDDEASFDASIGIPSTENVSIKTGAEAAMVDVYGYLCARPYDGNITVADNISNQGENEPGTSYANQAATRKITLKAQVSNCWGSNNPVCQLSKQVIWSKSYSGSHHDGAETKQEGHGCPGYFKNSCGCKDITCANVYYDKYHSASEFWCKNHYGGQPGWSSYSDHKHGGEGGSGGSCSDNDGFHNAGDVKGCKDGSVNPDDHDCSYSVTIYDSIGEEYLGQSMPLTGTASGSNSGSGSHGLVEISRGRDSGINIYWKISWKPSQDYQYYIVTYDVWNTDISSDVSGCNSASNGAYGNQSWGQSGTHFTGVNSNGVICNDYTHGTGSDGTHYENMVHPGTHNYTITYNETIDTYTYKTIENANVYTLSGIKLDSLHQLEVSYPDEDNDENTIQIYRDIIEPGTYNAPIASGTGESVSSPDAVGYLWRCVGGGDTGHGEYKSGNGRILFEAWKNKDAIADLGSNCSVSTGPVDYFLGDVEVTIKSVQDSEWGRDLSDVESWKPVAGTKGVANRGDKDDHIHDHVYKSTSKYHANCSDDKYKNNKGSGDCTETSGIKTRTDNSGNHNEIVKKEISAIMNYWCGQNSGLADGEQIYYKANVISDTLVYGGTSETNSFIEDAYAVDGEGDGIGFGVSLFNIQAEPSDAHTGPSIDESLGEKEAYRSHKSAYGYGNATMLKLDLKAGTFSSASVTDGGTVGMFGGVSENGTGGTVGVGTTIAHQMMTSLTSFGVGCSATRGDTVSSPVYSRELDVSATHSSDTSGITTIKVESKGATSSQKFAGYWRDFTYNTKGSATVTTYINGTPVAIDSSSEYGTACVNEYGTLAISNLPLTSWTPNGTVYTGQVSSKYIQAQIAEAPIPPEVPGGELSYIPRTQIQDGHDNIVGGTVSAPCGAGGTDFLNAITIYNPISSEYDYVIGAQYGKFEDSKEVSDDLKYDQRIAPDGSYLTTKDNYSSTTKPYVVQSRYLWSWTSPYGNFSTVGGSGSGTSEMNITSKTEVNKQTRNAGYKGYVDDMYIGKWVQTESFRYPFIAGFKDGVSHTTKPYVEIDKGYTVQAHAGVGGKASGQTKSSKLPTSKYFYGNAFAVTNTCNVVETDMDNPKSADSSVMFTTYAINPFVLSSDDYMAGSCYGGYIDAKEDNAGDSGNHKDMLANRVTKSDKVNLVGSIGNVTVHDVEDFRFSNYFKVPKSSWLIEGVIHDVNAALPRRVVSSNKDIMQREVNFYVEEGKIYNKNGTEVTSASGLSAFGHSSLGTTMYLPDKSRGGMAGPFDDLPLVPKYNTVDEYKTEAVRLGYKAFISVDTIGNYQSYIPETAKVPEGPDDEDTRTNYLSVMSQYYLYDFDDGKFYDVDIWSGSTGGKERLYNGTTRKTEKVLQAGSIFQDVNSESERRNIGVYELLDTLILLGTDDVAENTAGEYTIIYGNKHYIGQPGNLRLDTRDLTYIGSSNNDSDQRYWGESYMSVYEYSRNAQRYHFKDGLTSTTTLTEPLGDNPSQGDIKSANDKVREEHPHSVLVQFMDFTAKGSVWTIKVNGSAVNQDSFTVFDTTDDKYIPQDWDLETVKLHNEVKYQGADTYNPVTGQKSGSIDKDLTPVVVMQAFNTSADDRTVAGTH